MAAKDGRTVSVCLPARNEATTIGAIVETIRSELVDTLPLVDELLVLDDHSTDDTAAVASDAGATVVSAASVLPQFGPGHGKGEVPTGEHVVPLGKARVAREGSDVTVLGWLLMLHHALDAAQQLQAEGISAEVIQCRRCFLIR